MINPSTPNSTEILKQVHLLELKLLSHIQDCIKHNKRLNNSMYFEYKELQSQFKIMFMWEYNNGL